MLVKRIVLGVAAAALTGSAAACGGSGEGDGAPVSRASFEDDDLVWPFSLEEGTLHCEDGAVSFQARTGEVYGVNGVAIESGDYAAPDPIWLDASQADGEDGQAELLTGKAPLDDMIELGEQEC